MFPRRCGRVATATGRMPRGPRRSHRGLIRSRRRHVCIKGPVTVTIGPASGRVDLASLVLAEGATVTGQRGGRAVRLAGRRGRLLVGPRRLGDPRVRRHARRPRQAARPWARDSRARGRAASDARHERRVRLPASGRTAGARRPGTASGRSLDRPASSASRMTTAYRVEARGTVTITDEASLVGRPRHVVRARRPAPAVRASGTLEIENEQRLRRGGRPRRRPPAEHLHQPGLIKKSGSGASRIAADYSASGGSSTEVQDGSLLLPDGTKATAVVAAGSSYGTGICDLVSEECGPDTSDQVAWLTIPSSEEAARSWA